MRQTKETKITTGWSGSKNIRACKKQDLTKMSFGEVVNFSIAAIKDWPPSAMEQGHYFSERVFMMDERGFHSLPEFSMKINPKNVSVCAVGAILACDGAQAAWDVADEGKGTSQWKAHQAGDLFEHIINKFDGGDTVKEGRKATLAFLALVKKNLDTMGPDRAMRQAEWDSEG